MVQVLKHIKRFHLEMTLLRIKMFLMAEITILHIIRHHQVFGLMVFLIMFGRRLEKIPALIAVFLRQMVHLNIIFKCIKQMVGMIMVEPKGQLHLTGMEHHTII